MSGRFVVLEHDWNGVHFDVMLEREGVLWTWAVDEAIVPGRDLAARRLPGHRLAYLDYEGPISGDRGRVRRLDRGVYQVETWTEGRIRVVLEGDRWRGVCELSVSVPASGQAERWQLRFEPRQEVD